MTAPAVETIPDAWICGYLQSHPDQSVGDAVDWWMYQKDMEVMAMAEQTAIGQRTKRNAWRVVRRYPATSEDGHEAVVYVQTWPARFYRIVCEDIGLDLDTGSSMEELADQVAVAIADGMLGMTPEVER